jgi:hypothetical protein
MYRATLQDRGRGKGAIARRRGCAGVEQPRRNGAGGALFRRRQRHLDRSHGRRRARHRPPRDDSYGIEISMQISARRCLAA